MSFSARDSLEVIFAQHSRIIVLKKGCLHQRTSAFTRLHPTSSMSTKPSRLLTMCSKKNLCKLARSPLQSKAAVSVGESRHAESLLMHIRVKITDDVIQLRRTFLEAWWDRALADQRATYTGPRICRRSNRRPFHRHKFGRR